MKFLKLFSVVALSAVALFANAAIDAKCKITVTGGEGVDDLVLYQEASCTNIVTYSSPKTMNSGQAFNVNLYAVKEDANYSTVWLDDLSNLVVKFVANSVNTNYTMTFANVSGNIVLKRSDVDTTIVVDALKSYAFTCATGATVEFTVNPKAANIYTRTVESGKWGTICYDKQIDAVAGADMYEFVGINAAKTKVYVDPVTGSLAAGKAYLFNATAAQQDFTYTGDAVTVVTDNNGLLGVITENFTTTAQAWVVKGNEIMPAAAGSSVPQYRAYVDLDQIQGGEPTTQVPGRKVFNVVGEVTGLEAVDAAAAMNGKMMINGKFVIIRDGKMFNAQGAEL